MYRKNNRYVFSGCSVHSTQNPAMSCGCGDIEFTEASTTREYARLFVEPQQYENCACPEYALKNGTFSTHSTCLIGRTANAAQA